jgi:hypothetical protein
LPCGCDWGCKKNSKGKVERWRGYKLHVDSIDGDIPLSWVLTSASMHDSGAAIPLAQMSAQRVTSLYDLADAAYDAKEIRHRYAERSASERVNSHLHDNHGGRHVRVRGAVKVAAHLSFGLLVIAAEQLLMLLG